MQRKRKEASSCSKGDTKEEKKTRKRVKTNPKTKVATTTKTDLKKSDKTKKEVKECDEETQRAMIVKLLSVKEMKTFLKGLDDQHQHAEDLTSSDKAIYFPFKKYPFFFFCFSCFEMT